MEKIVDKYFEGERILYGRDNLEIVKTVFGHGESPLKETQDLKIKDSIFTWKYPLWYSKNIELENTTFETMARSGIWYTDNISIKNSALQAPKLFRRCNNVKLENVHFSDAQETLWTSKNIEINNSQVNGDYFGKDSENIKINNLNLIGNYCFDGAKNIEIHNSTLISKDAFWNCENVTIFDSTIVGEYLAWNSKKITFINCQIQSEQGLNYVTDLTLKNTSLIHSNLVFEYCKDIDADLNTEIESIKNPISGEIKAPRIKQLIIDPQKVDPATTKIICAKIDKKSTHSDDNQKERDEIEHEV